MTMDNSGCLAGLGTTNIRLGHISFMSSGSLDTNVHCVSTRSKCVCTSFCKKTMTGVGTGALRMISGLAKLNSGLRNITVYRSVLCITGDYATS